MHLDDKQFKNAGGEQYEMSFKIWQCHGRMLETACSRVGHIYRLRKKFSHLDPYRGSDMKHMHLGYLYRVSMVVPNSGIQVLLRINEQINMRNLSL